MSEYKQPEVTNDNTATMAVLTTLTKDMFQNFKICEKMHKKHPTDEMHNKLEDLVKALEEIEERIKEPGFTDLTEEKQQEVREELSKAVTAKKIGQIAERLNGIIDNIISKAVNGEQNERSANGPCPELLLDNEEYFNDLFTNSFISQDVKERFNKEIQTLKQHDAELKAKAKEKQRHLLEIQEQFDDVLAKMVSDLDGQKKDIEKVIKLLSNDDNTEDYEDLAEFLTKDIIVGIDGLVKEAKQCRESKSGYKEVLAKMQEFVHNCSEVMDENKEALSKAPKVSGILNKLVSSVKSFLNTITGNKFSSLFTEQKITLSAAKNHSEKHIQSLRSNIERLDEVQSKKEDPKRRM